MHLAHSVRHGEVTEALAGQMLRGIKNLEAPIKMRYFLTKGGR